MMKYMTTDEIREAYLAFFEGKGHKRIESDNLAPKDDPTLLFTGAGMNQFKKEFMGEVKDFTRATTSQKCIRTGDIENVGKTPCHHTFFEMLGNFSFGDYFKEEAITWAWELITNVYQISADRLYVSVYKEDDEAFAIWKDTIGIAEEKIFRLGEKTNYWPASAPSKGPNGPCGPCSEIFYDLGDKGCTNSSCDINCDCRRYVEIWNLVFTQFERIGGNELKPLPNKNIDTGMGLERIASVIQGKATNFEIDIFVPIVKKIEQLLSVSYKENKENDSAINAIADHVRAIVFAITDGILPSNTERGYVIRKLINKASISGNKLGAQQTFLYSLVPTVIEVMKQAYPELENRSEQISKIVFAEENRFIKTFGEGKQLLEDEIKKLREKSISVLSGEFVFKLHDTYGLSFDITSIIAEESKMKIDKDTFEKLMEEQRDRARASSQIQDAIFVKEDNPFKDYVSKFVGYDLHEAETSIQTIVCEGEEVASVTQGKKCEIVLEHVPFYAESGGQLADTGVLVKEGAEAIIQNVKKNDSAIILVAEVMKGEFTQGDIVEAKIDANRRKNIMRNHTATHLLHSVLRDVLGEHVHQAGSMVGPERLRFDFSHFEAIKKDQLNEIEEKVNLLIRKNISVVCDVLPIEEAKKSGALALFGEKYGDSVRVLSIGSVSKELCGGTHVLSTGDIGYFKIVTETSIASGVRRIEAMSGEGAFNYSKEIHAIVDDLAVLLNTRPDLLVEQTSQLVQKVKELEKTCKMYETNKLLSSLDDVVNKGKKIHESILICEKMDNANPDALRKIVDQLKKKISSGIIILLSVYDGKVHIICGVTPNLIEKGHEASKIIRCASEIVGGKGGGRKDLAFAGGKEIDKIDEAIANAKKEIEKIL